jgi:hypothetical protein
MDNFIRQLISIKFEDKRDVFTGILIDFSEDWLLLRNNPADFVIDGFVILRNKKIKSIYQEPEYDFVEKVIRLKNVKINPEDAIPLTDLYSILDFLTSKYSLFQIATKSDKAVYIGKLKDYNDDQMTIDFLSTCGKWDGEMDFKPNKVRVIEFDTDYLNSLKLVLEEKG